MPSTALLRPSSILNVDYFNRGKLDTDWLLKQCKPNTAGTFRLIAGSGDSFHWTRDWRRLSHDEWHVRYFDGLCSAISYHLSAAHPSTRNVTALEILVDENVTPGLQWRSWLDDLDRLYHVNQSTQPRNGRQCTLPLDSVLLVTLRVQCMDVVESFNWQPRHSAPIFCASDASLSFHANVAFKKQKLSITHRSLTGLRSLTVANPALRNSSADAMLSFYEESDGQTCHAFEQDIFAILSRNFGTLDRVTLTPDLVFGMDDVLSLCALMPKLRSLAILPGTARGISNLSGDTRLAISSLNVLLSSSLDRYIPGLVLHGELDDLELPEYLVTPQLRGWLTEQEQLGYISLAFTESASVLSDA